MPDRPYTGRRSRIEAARMARRVWAAVSADPNATIRELAAAADTSLDLVVRALRRLRDLGYIRYEDVQAGTRIIVVPFIITGRDE